MDPSLEHTGELLSTAQVAIIFGVGPATVTRWANAGLVASVRTLGGHRRFRRSEIYAHVTDVVMSSGATTPTSPPS